MKFEDFMNKENEKPLDRIVTDGGFCGIFRKIGCIGDSLSSGEMESMDESGSKGYHDYYEYSWGQYMARDVGCEVLNFSKGGMRADLFCDFFAVEEDLWNPEKKCQAYIIALGVNDINAYGENLGEISDVDSADWRNNRKTFAGYYGQIIQRLKQNQPKARFFLVTIPKSEDESRRKAEDRHQKLLYEMAELFDYTYVIDFRKYAPVYDSKFHARFGLGGHLNAAGYRLTAKMMESYMDYIIRNHMEDFAQAAFIGKPVHNCGAKW